MAYKIPISTLVVVHTPDLLVLLIERADYPGHWQSVTGSQEAGETLAETAVRELREETGIDADRYGGVRGRYWPTRSFPAGASIATGIRAQLFPTFSLEVPAPFDVALSRDEHTAQRWLPWGGSRQRVFVV